MKKLMTMIAAVATAFGLYAADDTGTSFEGTATAGGTLADEVGKITELSGGASSADWWNGATGKATIKEYGTETPYTPRPAQYTGDQYTYLKLETGTEELTRYTDSAKAGVNVLTLKDKEYVFDSLVNLTAFEDAPDMTEGKLAVWLQDLSEAETPVAQTNLMVSMIVNSQQVNYNCGNLADLNLDLIGKWARVTIKALDIGNSKIGFVVYINGSNSPVSSIDTIDYTSFTLNDVAQYYADNMQLFPYAGDTTIASVGFKGIGSIDDLVFTETVPDFAADVVKYTVVWDPTKVGTVSFEPVATEIDYAKGTATFLAQSLPPSVTMSWTANAEYAAGGKTLTPSKGATDTLVENDYNKGVAKVDETAYATITEAIAAAGTENAVVLLAAEVGAFAVDKAVTIDLNGKKIASSDAGVAAITLADGAALVIDDALTTGNVAGFEGGDAIVLADQATATVTIKAGQFDGYVCINNIDAVTVDAAAFGKLKVSKDNADTFDTSKCTLNPPTGYEFVLKSDYFELQEKPTKATLAVTTPVNGTLSTSPEAGDVDIGATVTVTATPDANYHLVKITTNGVELATTSPAEFVMPADDVTVAAEFAIDTYELTVTPAVNGTLSTSPAAGSVAVGATVTITADPDENYELDSITTNNVPLAEGVKEFVMPAENVTVAATFKAKSTDPIDDPGALEPTGEANLAALKDALPIGTDINAWAADVYADGKIPAEKLNASTEELIAAAATYNLEVMASPVEIKATGSDADGFTFTITDKEGDSPIVAATRAQQMMVYTTDLKATFSRDLEKKAVNAAVAGETIKVTFTGDDLTGKAAEAGFMKIDLSKDIE